jgi:hypothetical protein
MWRRGYPLRTNGGSRNGGIFFDSDRLLGWAATEAQAAAALVFEHGATHVLCRASAQRSCVDVALHAHVVGLRTFAHDKQASRDDWLASGAMDR